MQNYQYRQLLLDTANNYDAMSQELFKLAKRLETTPRYNPENELYSLVRTSELNTLAVRSLAARVMGPNTPTIEDNDCTGNQRGGRTQMAENNGSGHSPQQKRT